MKEFKRRRVNGVTPKIPKEIAMFLDHRHSQTSAGEQQARHHAGRPPPNDQQNCEVPVHPALTHNMTAGSRPTWAWTSKTEGSETHRGNWALQLYSLLHLLAHPLYQSPFFV